MMIGAIPNSHPCCLICGPADESTAQRHLALTSWLRADSVSTAQASSETLWNFTPVSEAIASQSAG
jgi:hypothetical protein